MINLLGRLMPASLGGINMRKHSITIVLSVIIIGLSLMRVLPDCNPLTFFKASSSQEGMFDDMDSVCVINLVDDGTITASGTGFLYSTEGIPYIVTNKHVVSRSTGTDPNRHTISLYCCSTIRGTCLPRSH